MLYVFGLLPLLHDAWEVDSMNKYHRYDIYFVIIQGFDKPALVMDYSVTSGFYMGYCDPPWGKPLGHL